MASLITVNTKSTPKKKTTAKKSSSSSTLKTAKDVTSLASGVLTVDKKLRDSKDARAKDKEAKVVAKAAPKPGEKRTCPSCGNVDVSGAKTCPACDADMTAPPKVQKKTCPNCGNVDVSGAKTCPACNAKMN